MQRLSRRKLRLLGLLPLAFFCAQAIHYWQINELGHMLWMCNIGNLLLALGLLFEHRIVIRVAVIWMIPGLVVWLIYVVPTWGMLIAGKMSMRDVYGVISSTLAHMGGISVAMVALMKIGMDKNTWFFAFVWYLIVQMASRLLTPPAMNVNLSQRVQDGWEQSFTVYWKFWLVLSSLVALGCLLLSAVLKRLSPAREMA